MAVDSHPDVERDSHVVSADRPGHLAVASRLRLIEMPVAASDRVLRVTEHPAARARGTPTVIRPTFYTCCGCRFRGSGLRAWMRAIARLVRAPYRDLHRAHHRAVLPNIFQHSLGSRQAGWCRGGGTPNGKSLLRRLFRRASEGLPGGRAGRAPLHDRARADRSRGSPCQPARSGVSASHAQYARTLRAYSLPPGSLISMVARHQIAPRRRSGGRSG